MNIFRKFLWPRRRPSTPIVQPSTLNKLMSDCDGPDRCDTGLFVASAMRAAESAQSSHRRTILTDVAGILRCDVEELGFMFFDPVIAANDSDPVMLPDYRAVLHAEMSAVSR